MNEIKGIKISQTFSYEEYKKLINTLFLMQKTTGNNHSDAMLSYTKLNIQRMKRLDKKVILTYNLANAIQNYKKQVNWVVFTEAWCGDAAQNLPVINKMASLSEYIDLKIVLRDENLSIMEHYKTDGGIGIPKLVVFDKNTLKELTTWGPRPAPLQQMVIENKNSTHPIPYQEFSVTVQKWYNEDENITIQKEFLDVLNK